MSMDEGNNNHRDNVENVEKEKEIVEKDFVPHFLPTYRIKINIFPLPIITVIVIAGILAYLTYFIAGVQIEGGYFSEEQYGALGGILNGIIFTVLSVISAFIIVFIIRKKGIDVLKYIFGFTFGFLGFFLTWFFVSILIYLIFILFPETAFLVNLYYITSNIISPIMVGVFTFFLLYKYFKSKTIFTKNAIVLYNSLLIGASMGIFLPLWTTIAILIGISFWDMYAVLHKRGPIKEMIDIASNSYNNDLVDESLEIRVKSGEAIYDTSRVEIGIGDLAFYSLLTSSSLIQTDNLFVMIFTSIAILIGTGITLMGLKRNKILPGLPISIFLGIGTMFLSWYLFSIL
jgi:hypothetical protein